MHGFVSQTMFYFCREKDVIDKLPNDNITRYDVKWTENGIDLKNKGLYGELTLTKTFHPCTSVEL